MKLTRIVSLIFALLFVLFAASCGGGETEKSYKTDFSVETLYKNVEKKIALEKEDLSFRDVKELTLSMATGISDVVAGGNAEYAVRYTGGYSCDEYGVFKFKTPAEASEAKAKFDAYLKSKAEDTTQRSYYGEEAYKYDESEVKVFGCCVAYAILNKENRDVFFSTIEQLLLV